MLHDDKFCIMYNDGNNLEPKVVIYNINLLICTKKLSDVDE